MHEIVPKIRNGVYLPKSIFNTSSYGQKYKTGINMIDPKMIPPPVDWVYLFNLGVFVVFICSLFYICLYRYRNKEKIRKEKELKQQQLVIEFKKLLEEEAEKKKQEYTQQLMHNRSIMQKNVSSNIDNVKLNFENPYSKQYHQSYFNDIMPNNTTDQNYELNFDPLYFPNFSNNYNQHYMQNKNMTLNYNQSNSNNKPITYNQIQSSNNNNYSETSFFNQVGLKNY
jgi:hypothetical protein